MTVNDADKQLVNHVPKVSVVVPCYNAEKTISETLASIFNQTMKDFELIVVDDGSTDGSAALVESTADERLKLVHQKNKGPAGARNAGISVSRGEFVAFMDSDDLWAPQFLETTVAALESEPAAGMAAANLIWQLTPDDRETLFFNHVGFDPSKGEIVLEDLIDKNIIQITSTLIRRETLLKAGGFDEKIRGPEDYDLWLRVAALRQKIISLSEPLGFSRRYVEGSVSKNNAGMAQNYLSVCEKFLRENSDKLTDEDAERLRKKYTEGREYLYKLQYRELLKQKKYSLAAEQMEQVYKLSGDFKHILIYYALKAARCFKRNE